MIDSDICGYFTRNQDWKVSLQKSESGDTAYLNVCFYRRKIWNLLLGQERVWASQPHWWGISHCTHLAFTRKLLKTNLLLFSSCPVNCVTDSRGDAEGRRAQLAEGPELRRKHFPSLWDVKFPLVLLLVLFCRCDWSWRTEHCLPQEGALLIMNWSGCTRFNDFMYQCNVLHTETSVCRWKN